MTRIFTTLAVITLVLLAANIVLGLWIGDYNGTFAQAKLELVSLDKQIRQLQSVASADNLELRNARAARGQLLAQYKTVQRRATVHILFGIGAALGVVLVNSISITYFIGTSRWCKEVVQAYGFDPQLARRSASLKRRTFPWALGGMLVVVGLIALGAAANPGTIRPGTDKWVLPHYIGALAGTALIGLSLIIQRGNMNANYRLITQIIEQVRCVRAERGLDEDK